MKYCIIHRVLYSDNYVCTQCIDGAPPFVQNNEQREEIEVTYCKTKDEAQALSNFLWNEKERHVKDIRDINLDLVSLEIRWNVKPTKIKVFIKP